MKQSITGILDAIEKLFPNAKIELKYNTPFQLLVAVILSAQTTDVQVNKATQSLFQKVKNPQDILNLWEDKLKDNIKTLWFFNAKARNIYNTSKILVEQYWSKIPDKLEQLISLPWIGLKTAKIILNQLYDWDYIAVDTHVKRIANRLGLVDSQDADFVSSQLEKLVPQDYKRKSHHLLIFFGRYHCIAKNPKCNECPFTSFCKYFNQINKK